MVPGWGREAGSFAGTGGRARAHGCRTHLFKKARVRLSVRKSQLTPTPWIAPAARSCPGSGFCPGPSGLLPAPPISSQAERPGDWAHAFPSLSSKLLPIRCCGGPALRPGMGLMGLVVREDSGGRGGAVGGALDGEMGRAALGGETTRQGAVA